MLTSALLVLYVLQLESLNQSELASRLTLNCQNSYVEPHKIKDVVVTIIDVSVKPSFPIGYTSMTFMYISTTIIQSCFLCEWCGGV